MTSNTHTFSGTIAVPEIFQGGDFGACLIPAGRPSILQKFMAGTKAIDVTISNWLDWQITFTRIGDEGKPEQETFYLNLLPVPKSNSLALQNPKHAPGETEGFR